MQNFNWEAGVAVLIAVIGWVTPLLSKLMKAPRAVNSMVSTLNAGLLTHQEIDAAVERFLSKGEAPSQFIDFVGDLVADIVTKVPNYLLLPKEQRQGIIAAVVSDQTKAKLRDIIPGIPEKILSMKWARRRFVQTVLHELGWAQPGDKV
jgi:hypothetical protein